MLEILISFWDEGAVKLDLKDFMKTGIENKTFPLQTLQSMAERWGRSKQTINNWAMRHTDFPKPLEGIIEQTSMTPRVYALKDVERYEKLKGLKK